MESATEKDWKKKIGFPINYDSDQSSDDDFGGLSGERAGVVVQRAGRGAGRGAAGQLLADAGDGAEVDLLGTTPPRARIRDKEKRRPIYRSNTCGDVAGGMYRPLAAASPAPVPHAPERLRKRASLKLVRARERDHKVERGGGRADSLPSPSPSPSSPATPSAPPPPADRRRPLWSFVLNVSRSHAPPPRGATPSDRLWCAQVESCSRFMSLSSRLKCSAGIASGEADAAEGVVARGPALPQLPASRVSFHSTFSMLINMGNVDKGCKRTVSREEQVWQNELKDLIWLALRARLAGRSLAQQDAFLCAQRRSVPALLQTLLDYRFVNPYPCPGAAEAEVEAEAEVDAEAEAGGRGQTCLSAECGRCVAGVGRCMREVRALLEAVEAAEALYPSGCAAEADQPELARPALKHRIRAMCLWYNTALHMRLKLVSLRRMVRERRARPALRHLASSDSSSDYSSPLPAGSGEASPASPSGHEGSAPASPLVDSEPPSFVNIEHAGEGSAAVECGAVAVARRVREAVWRLDAARDAALRERRLVGRALPALVPTYEPKLRQLTFKWQRGLKIGAGTFGKVYTVVNTESGQLLAMKELSVGAGDRRALQRAANELRVLEGVLHPHLVRYYGCELHREEMLLFMELCVEGSLEALVGASGALAEPTVRRYTKQLVSAVAELHSRGIAHRDIKSECPTRPGTPGHAPARPGTPRHAPGTPRCSHWKVWFDVHHVLSGGNIFLTNEGHCLKLGDFGCAVKIRANTTAPGELQGFVGTQAYMAPEVFMKSSGHGRAADVWSLGCVVTEMASGKRPFPEYDSNYQIMFVVGMGGGPALPDALSPEGRDFCARCLTHDPDLRPRAADLALHHFLLVKADEDCRCEPAYLMA
ncbi:Mitogen-activated protein kinase kinase kinase 4 [Papilio xuthus]|uniref:Mitogen-activated protein kinase kinase kinase 4 n=1 Tax=Papilio xuthus TaxID=66420 RepID=A0A194Q821_PAPXU|nr:Mitogen-activated protein kinase kinase kinase 4 [Papilio xuthus]